MLLGLVAWLFLSVPEGVLFTPMVEGEGTNNEGNGLAGVITWESSDGPLSSPSSDPQECRSNRCWERKCHPLEIFSKLSPFWTPTKLKAEADKHLKAGPHFDFVELTYSLMPHPVEETFSHAWAFGCPMCGSTSQAKSVLLSLFLLVCFLDLTSLSFKEPLHILLIYFPLPIISLAPPKRKEP